VVQVRSHLLVLYHAKLALLEGMRHLSPQHVSRAVLDFIVVGHPHRVPRVLRELGLRLLQQHVPRALLESMQI
jgi:hypothetical protein